MRKVLALMIALLTLTLTACGNESAEPVQSQPEESSSAESVPVETNAEGYYVQEKVKDDGTKMTAYRIGSPDGPFARVEIINPDGTTLTETYFADGTVEHRYGCSEDGTEYDCTFYPNGSPNISIYRYADGSYWEYHFLNNGFTDPETGLMTSGTIIYTKQISASGHVEEHSYDFTQEADGSTWIEQVMDDGSIIKTHYSETGLALEQIVEDPVRGTRSEVIFYENGYVKNYKVITEGADTYNYLEYYENGIVKYRYTKQEGNAFTEEKISELSYTTYLHIKAETLDKEFFADENGNLLKCVSNGATYEGDAISDTDRDMFQQIKTRPPATEEKVETIENMDGTRLQRTTYSDGTVVEDFYEADGRHTVRNTIQADGSSYYVEYYENKRIKTEIATSAGGVYTRRYDEEEYLIYYKEDFGDFVTEITTDENGKVEKVTVNGVEQADVSVWKSYLKFRSW